MRMGIRGFEPSFLVGVEAIKAVHGPRLAALAGRRLSGFAVVRFAEDGEWFADCPVVLDFDGVQVEVCHWKLDELSIGWDAIDTTVAIAGWERAGFTPVWSHADERLEPFVGQELHEVTLLEWRPPGPDLAAGTVAVEFAFGCGGRFRVANGLDENRVETGAAQLAYVRHRLDPLSSGTALAVAQAGRRQGPPVPGGSSTGSPTTPGLDSDAQARATAAGHAAEG